MHKTMIEYKLSKIGRFCNGANFSPDQLGTGTKFVNLDDIYKEKDLKSSDTFEYVALKNEDNYLLEDGDILFVRSSVKPSGVGYPCLFKVDSNDKVVFCGFIIRYRFDQSKVFPKYLLYQLLLQENRNKVIARGQVVANTNINQRGLGSLNIRLHNLVNEQAAIATILSKVDEAIEATQTSIKFAKKLKKSLMQNLLTGKLKPDGTRRTEDEFYNDDKFGKYPKDWIFFTI
jgi:type I restriction enzyme, S subunit